MHKIAVLGANGQVGMEMCLLLKCWEGIEVTAFCRNHLSSVALRRLGIECYHGDSSSSDLRDQLAAHDLIFDLRLPGGNYTEVTQEYRRMYDRLFEHLPSSAVYVLASSQMALGFGGSTNKIKHYWISRTVYGATKRFAEKYVGKLCQSKGNRLYVLRLAQVHGLLQSCSHSLRKIASEYPQVSVFGGPSYTVFCFTIAEAIVNALKGIEEPGTYTLDSSPAWTWQEVLCYLAGKEVSCVERQSPRTTVLSLIRQSLSKRIERMNEPLQVHVLRWFPMWENKLRNAKRRAAARQAISQLDSSGRFELDLMYGTLPGKRMRHLSDSRVSMQEQWNRCTAILSDLQIARLETHSG